jgi:hypothetical protein
MKRADVKVAAMPDKKNTYSMNKSSPPPQFLQGMASRLSLCSGTAHTDRRSNSV